MALPPGDIARLASTGLPVLCIDTCSILDIMRDPTRDTASPHEAEAALHLLGCVDSPPKLVALVCEQVRIELGEHIDRIEKEANHALQKLSARIAQVDAVAAEFGAIGTALSDHWQGHAFRARQRTERLIAASELVSGDAATADRALARVNKALAPARRGKESMKDCVVLETYLDAVAQLRSAGLMSRVVLLSSNTKDYTDESRHLRPELVSELAALNMEYAPNFGAARHLLQI